MVDKNLLLLASKMLKMASSEFSNHGCNDLPDDISSLIDENILMDIRKYTGEDYPSTPSNVGDSLLMSYLSNKLCNL